jgi:hypothetical protein
VNHMPETARMLLRVANAIGSIRAYPGLSHPTGGLKSVEDPGRCASRGHSPMSPTAASTQVSSSPAGSSTESPTGNGTPPSAKIA